MEKRDRKKSLASELRHPVYIQTYSDVSDGEGGFTKTWTDPENTTYAGIYPMSAAQVYEFKTVQVDATHKLKFRGYVTIDDSGEYQIKFGTRIFEILTVENVQERDVVKWCMCKEKR